MRDVLASPRSCVRMWVALACLAGASAAAPVPTRQVTYQLNDVWLLPDVSHPGQSARQMTGSFRWTYQDGDFENGSGQMIDLNLPWFNPALEDLNFTIETGSIEITLKGSYHDRGVDVSLHFLEPLSPNQPSTVDPTRSTFDLEYGVSHKGHAISGTADPDLSFALLLEGTCPTDVRFTLSHATPNGKVALLYAFSEGAFVLPTGLPCSGTVLGLDNTLALGFMLTANANGGATLNISVPGPACGLISLQALDLSSCDTTNVVLLQ